MMDLNRTHLSTISVTSRFIGSGASFSRRESGLGGDTEGGPAAVCRAEELMGKVGVVVGRLQSPQACVGILPLPALRPEVYYSAPWASVSTYGNSAAQS